MLDIREKDLAEVRSILAEFFANYDVYAFGSRTKGTAKPYSDLDLVVMTASPLPLRTLALAEEAFSQSNIPYKIDLLDWASLSAEFQEIIQAHSILIQKAII